MAIFIAPDSAYTEHNVHSPYGNMFLSPLIRRFRTGREKLDNCHTCSFPWKQILVIYKMLAADPWELKVNETTWRRWQPHVISSRYAGPHWRRSFVEDGSHRRPTSACLSPPPYDRDRCCWWQGTHAGGDGCVSKPRRFTLPQVSSVDRNHWFTVILMMTSVRWHKTTLDLSIGGYYNVSFISYNIFIKPYTRSVLLEQDRVLSWWRHQSKWHKYQYADNTDCHMS